MSPSATSPFHCPQCGAALPEAPEGLCPRCLMAQVMQPTQAEGTASALPPLTPAELAPHFPQLEILECLGRGGMGVVYKARQKALHRLVALKLLAPERAGDPAFAARFAREAQALAALSHPHIVGVYDFGQAGGFYYLLMEFVDGVNLRQLLQTRRLTPQEALSIVPPVCEALQCAHDHGIVHRDIKPENLLIDKAGKVKIADFGVAKMVGAQALEAPRSAAGGLAGAGPSFTQASGQERAEGGTASPQGSMEAPRSQGLGTPDYAAPEQQNGTTADHRADIYSLGVVLYEMLTGERPQEKLEPPSKRVQVDIRIDEIVLRALEKSPELRFATAAEFRTQVEQAAGLRAQAGSEGMEVDLSRHTEDGGNWYLYFLYFCREDPRIVVQKRIGGLGWTVNLARPLALPFVALVFGIFWAAMEVLWWYHASGAVVNSVLVLLVAGLVVLCHRMSRPRRRVRSAAVKALRRRHLLLACLGLAGAYASLMVFVLGTLGDLPRRTAIHFGLEGWANGWSTPEANAAFVLSGPLGVVALFALIWWLTRRFPAVFPLNVPRRDHWERPEHREEALLIMGRYFLWFCAILTLFMGAVHYLVLQANASVPPRLPPGTLIPMLVGFFGLVVLWLVAFMHCYADVRPPAGPDADMNAASRRRQTVASVLAVLGVAAMDFWVLPAVLESNAEAPRHETRITSPLPQQPPLILPPLPSMPPNAPFPPLPNLDNNGRPSIMNLQVDLKTLPVHDFDQTPGQYWRELAEVRRYRDAAMFIEYYMALRPDVFQDETPHTDVASLHFHAAQCWALAGEAKAALSHLPLARHAVSTGPDGLRWNDYVEGTRAFLSGDRPALVRAIGRLIDASPVNRDNLAALNRLLSGFGRSYAEAYQADDVDAKKLSAECFNRTWELLEKKDRTAADDEQMLSLAHASLAFWRLRKDCTDRNLSIGHWQISRVYAVLGQGANARVQGEQCLAVSGKEPPFYQGYAHEALARAFLLLRDRAEFDEHFAQARALAAQVEAAEEKKMLEDDLAELAAGKW